MTEKKLPRTAPVFIGDKVYLRPVTPEDMANVHHWFLMSDPSALSCRPLTVRAASDVADRFRKLEPTPFDQHLVAVRIKDNTPVARVHFFDLNTHNRSAELGLLVDPDERRKGFGREALYLVCRYLFDHRGLNKVYAQTAAFNQGAIRLLEKMGFQRDGVLRRHYFHMGEFHDGLVYSMLQHEFE